MSTSRHTFRRAYSGSRCAITIFALLATSAPLACEAAARASLDRQVANPGEPIMLSITSDAASSGGQPDLSPLNQDFQLLGTSTSSETMIVNGHRSDQLRWDIRLQPKHAGPIEIPPITVGPDRTAELQVNVVQASPAQQAADAQHAFLEVDANSANASPYVQQQIPYTMRLFYDDSVTPLKLDVPAPESAAVDQLGPDKHYTAIRHGHNYHVIERDYAIAPEKSGSMVIAAPTFQGTAAVASAPSNDPDSQDEFISSMLVNTPFANMPNLRAAFGSATRPVSAQGQPVTLEVKPRPAGAEGQWLPAEQLVLQDSWAAGVPAFKVGEPVTRVVTIQAKGLAASQIPSLTFTAPANTNVYPESPVTESRTDGQSIYGSSKQSVTYIPTQAGNINIPAVDLTWWDVGSNVARHATLPVLHLQVSPGAVGHQAGEVPAVSASAPTQIAQGIAAVAQPPGVVSRKAIFGIAALAVLAVFAAILAFALYRRRGRPSIAPGNDEAKASPLPRKAALMRALRDACEVDAAHAASRALLDLSKIEWPDDPPQGLGALSARIGSGRVEVIELDRHLYGVANSRWSGAPLWQAVRNGLRSAQPPVQHKSNGLEPLYPTTAAN